MDDCVLPWGEGVTALPSHRATAPRFQDGGLGQAKIDMQTNTSKYFGPWVASLERTR